MNKFPLDNSKFTNFKGQNHAISYKFYFVRIMFTPIKRRYFQYRRSFVQNSVCIKDNLKL